MLLLFMLEVYWKVTVSQQQILDFLSFRICVLRSMHQWKVSVHNMNASGCEKAQWLDLPSHVPEYSAKETHLRGIERQPSRTELIQFSLSDLHGALEFWIADNVKVVRC